MSLVQAEREADSENLISANMRLFTFWVEENLYGVDISRVLSVSQELGGLRPMPGERHDVGLLGMVEFQNQVVPVVDFAAALGLQSGIEQAEALVTTLKDRESEHIDWVVGLESSLTDNVCFAGARDPRECAFGQWYDSFATSDETLAEILRGFDGPHKRIHALADHLLAKKQNGELEEALRIMAYERDVTLARLCNRFELARDHVRESVRPVLLFITEDGESPSLALKIDRINDVLEYDRVNQLPMDRLGKCVSVRTMAILEYYLHQEDGDHCLMVDPMQIVDLPDLQN